MLRFPVNAYGDTSRGALILPPRAEPGARYPLVIVAYSLNALPEFLRGAHGDEIPVQVLAGKGVAVLVWDGGVPDVDDVGPVVSDSDWYHRGIRYWASPAKSFELAIHVLDSLGVIDAASVGIAGQSHGAEVAGYAITHSDVFCAAAAANSSSLDPWNWYMGSAAFRNRTVVAGLGFPEGAARKRWAELSPALNAASVRAPMLLQVPDRELPEVWQWYSTLVELGKPIELVTYDDEYHHKWQPQHLVEAYERYVDWFAYWLRGSVDSASGKTEQYARWQVLREREERSGGHQCSAAEGH
jgi:dipeptidyl aminopeptidase/acylaminoacyl peptidase